MTNLLLSGGVESPPLGIERSSEVPLLREALLTALLANLRGVLFALPAGLVYINSRLNNLLSLFLTLPVGAHD